MHEQQEEHRASEDAVAADHQRAPAETIREQAAERRGEGAETEHEEDETRTGARAGQLLHPDRHHDEHRPVAEGRERLSGDEQARVAVGEEAAHQARSRARWRTVTRPA